MEKQNYVTAKEMAEILRVPISWIYQNTSAGKKNGIPFVKVGKYVRFDVQKVRSYFEQQKVERERGKI